MLFSRHRWCFHFQATSLLIISLLVHSLFQSPESLLHTVLLAFCYCHCYLISQLKSSACHEMPHCALFASHKTEDSASTEPESFSSFAYRHRHFRVDYFFRRFVFNRLLLLTYWSTFINEIWRLSLNKLSMCSFHLLELQTIWSCIDRIEQRAQTNNTHNNTVNKRKNRSNLL